MPALAELQPDLKHPQRLFAQEGKRWEGEDVVEGEVLYLSAAVDGCLDLCCEREDVSSRKGIAEKRTYQW